MTIDTDALDKLFAPARDLTTGRDVEAATVPGAPLTEDQRRAQRKRPALTLRQARAWPGDVVVRFERDDGSTCLFVLRPEEAADRIAARE